MIAEVSAETRCPHDGSPMDSTGFCRTCGRNLNGRSVCPECHGVGEVVQDDGLTPCASCKGEGYGGVGLPGEDGADPPVPNFKIATCPKCDSRVMVFRNRATGVYAANCSRCLEYIEVGEAPTEPCLNSSDEGTKALTAGTMQRLDSPPDDEWVRREYAKALSLVQDTRDRLNGILGGLEQSLVEIIEGAVTSAQTYRPFPLQSEAAGVVESCVDCGLLFNRSHLKDCPDGDSGKRCPDCLEAHLGREEVG
jgi:ribosomal protein S27E